MRELTKPPPCVVVVVIIINVAVVVVIALVVAVVIPVSFIIKGYMRCNVIQKYLTTISKINGFIVGEC